MPKIDSNSVFNPESSLLHMIEEELVNIHEMRVLGKGEFYKLKSARQRLNDLIQTPDNVSQIEIDKAQNDVRVWERRLEKARNGR